MGRGPRKTSATGYYHVVTRGNQRQPVFRAEADYGVYCEFVTDAVRSFSVQVAHFCLMPNHVHLLVQTDAREALSRAMHQLQRRYWFYWRRSVGLSGHLWQGRFHSFPIDSEAYLLEAARYIERNPLEAQLIPTLEAYPWSSYRVYIGGHPRLCRRFSLSRWVPPSWPDDRPIERSLRRRSRTIAP